MIKNRNWTVLIIGGPSGTGKSSLAYQIADAYGVNVLEVDDIHLSVKAVTTKQQFPAIHYWDSGIDWKSIETADNVRWLIDVSKEMSFVLNELACRHIEDQLPVIIEGDFIHPELAASLDNAQIKSIFLRESDKGQILQNYLSREGGELQEKRADISIAYGAWLSEACRMLEIPIIEARPWDTAVDRALSLL